MYLYITGSRPDTEQIVGVAVAQRISRAHRALVPDPAALPGSQPNAAAWLGSSAQPSCFAQRSSPAGFGADSTAAAGEATGAPGIRTPPPANLAAGDAASPSGAGTPNAAAAVVTSSATAATPTAAGGNAQRRLSSQSNAKRHKSSTLQTPLTWFMEPRAADRDAAAMQPTVSAASESATPRVTLGATPAASRQVDSAVEPRTPLAPLPGCDAPAAADGGGAPPLCTPRVGSSAAPDGSRHAAAAHDVRAAGHVAGAAAPGDPAAAGDALPATPAAAACLSSGVALEQHTGRLLSAQQQQRRRQLGSASALVVDRGAREDARCGVRVMWVSSEARLKGIAGQLLDAIRWVQILTCAALTPAGLD